MNREDLDAFFAKADDVLTDWYGSTDAMNTTEPERVEAHQFINLDAFDIRETGRSDTVITYTLTLRDVPAPFVEYRDAPRHAQR